MDAIKSSDKRSLLGPGEDGQNASAPLAPPPYSTYSYSPQTQAGPGMPVMAPGTAPQGAPTQGTLQYQQFPQANYYQTTYGGTVGSAQPQTAWPARVYQQPGAVIAAPSCYGSGYDQYHHHHHGHSYEYSTENVWETNAHELQGRWICAFLLSIFTCIFCVWPLGIFAIMFASLARCSATSMYKVRRMIGISCVFSALSIGIGIPIWVFLFISASNYN